MFAGFNELSFRKSLFLLGMMKRAGNVFLPPPRVTLCTFQLHVFADSSDSELQLDLIGPTSPSRDAALIKIK